MPRIRTLKPEHRQHRKVGPLTDREYRLWVSMILEADDAGRLVCDASQLRIQTWPYWPRVTIERVEAAIQQLATLGLILLYRVRDVRYAVLPSWLDHQRISHPAPSKFPSLEHSLKPPEESGGFQNPPQGIEGIRRERIVVEPVETGGYVDKPGGRSKIQDVPAGNDFDQQRANQQAARDLLRRIPPSRQP